MIEYKELRNDIDRYLMERFKYSKYYRHPEKQPDRFIFAYQESRKPISTRLSDYRPIRF